MGSVGARWVGTGTLGGVQFLSNVVVRTEKLGTRG